MFSKKQKTILCQVCDTGFHKRCTQISGRNFNLVLRNNANCYCQSCLVKNVPLSEVNESPINYQNQWRSSLTNIIITPNSNKSDFYDSCNSIEVPFNDDNHHIFINSKYFNINEINSLKAKENHFGMLHLNIASLNKHIEGLSNLLSLMKLDFPFIGFSWHKIGLNTPINNTPLPDYAFCFDETKSTHGGTGFFINKKYFYTKQSDLNDNWHGKSTEFSLFFSWMFKRWYLWIEFIILFPSFGLLLLRKSIPRDKNCRILDAKLLILFAFEVGSFFFWKIDFFAQDVVET